MCKKEASLYNIMIICDLLETIKEGRNITENIRKFIRYLLTSNVGRIILMLLTLYYRIHCHLSHYEILLGQFSNWWLTCNGIKYGAKRPEKNVMNEKPRHRNEQILSRVRVENRSRGLLIGLVSLILLIMPVIICRMILLCQGADCIFND